MKTGIFLAVLAAALYAINAPLSKIMLDFMPPTLMAGFLYIGAGVGMILIALVRRIQKTGKREKRLSRGELPYTVAMILLDIAAPIFLLVGLNATTAANASLLNNFEIVATAMIALCVFREKISPRLWGGILSRFPVRSFRSRIFQACAFPMARCLCCWRQFAGALKTTVRARFR